MIGAGPAGLKAAEVLAGRGFKTVVFERGTSAGGQLNLADKPPLKDKIDWCTEDLEAAARRAGVEFRFGTEPSTADLEALNPYAVVVVTGALPVVPDIPGVRSDNVCTVNEVLEGKVTLQGECVAVIGSGLTGLETAEKLAEDGNLLLVVEMMDEIGPGAYWENLEDVLCRLKAHNVELVTSHKLVAIGDGEITLEVALSPRPRDRRRSPARAHWQRCA